MSNEGDNYMDLHPEEITKIIKDQIRTYSKKIEQRETGYVIQIGDGIARVHGLENCMSNELLLFSNGSYGMALNLEEAFVSTVMLGSDSGISEGDVVKRTGKVVSVPVGDSLLGRVVNALGQPIDGKGEIKCTESEPIESEAPGIITRKSVDRPLQTGIKAIDSMIPIGKGQRELIIGDRQTGKTVIAVDTILNQRGKDVVCIYVAHRSEALHGRAGSRNSECRRSNGLYHYRIRNGFRACAASIYCALCGLHNGRIFYEAGQGRADSLRRPFKTRRRIQSTFIADKTASGT